MPETTEGERAPAAAISRSRATDVINVAVIEDNRLVRQGITALLSQIPDLSVVVGTGRGDVATLSRARPDVILLDIGLRSGDSLQVAEGVIRDLPNAGVIVMDLLPVHEDILEFVHIGVSGFITKDATLEDLVRTIRSVAGGTRVLPPQMTGTLFSQIANAAVVGDRPGKRAVRMTKMTKRERQVITLISEGLGNKQIAARLHISIHTVKSHVRNIMEKLALHSRLQVAAYAHRQEES